MSSEIAQEQDSKELYAAVQHRFYEDEYPKPDDVVMAKVTKIEDIGVYVTLLEYNGIEGFVPTSELSRCRIRSIAKIIRIGRIEAFCVLRVDQNKGYVDLSKRKVPREDMLAADDRYQMGKKVQLIIGHLAVEKHLDIDELYETIVWPLARIYDHCYKAFLIAVNDPESVFKNINISDDVKEALIASLSERMATQPKKVRADVQVTCFDEAGIEGIKDAMRQGMACGTEKNPINIALTAPPNYVITLTHQSEKEGVEILNRCIETIERVIKTYRGGSIVINVPPRVTQKSEDQEYDGMLKRYEMENRQVDGDSDTDDYDE